MSRIPQVPNKTPQGGVQGKLLIASPRLMDARFAQRVVLVLHQDPQGVMGIVLNEPVEDTTGIPANLREALATTGNHLFVGGPVRGSIVAIVFPQGNSEGDGTPTAESLATRGRVLLLGPDADENLRLLRQHNGTQLRLYFGHSGWEPGQLESELAQGVWLVADPVRELLEHERQGMWIEAVRHVGRNVYREGLKIRRFPDDATLN